MADSPDGAGVTLRVVLADDQAVVREGLVTLLGLLPGVEVVGLTELPAHPWRT